MWLWKKYDTVFGNEKVTINILLFNSKRSYFRYDMSLKDYLIQNQPKASTSISMLTQLLEAVDFLVKSNIAHRDLKCDNILVSLEYGKKNNKIFYNSITIFYN